MRESSSARARVKYVLCRGPQDDAANDCLLFLAEVFPASLTDGRLCRLVIGRTALAAENRPRTLAHTAGFRTIEAISDKRFLRSVRPSEEVIQLSRLDTADELRDAVDRALQKTEALLAGKCPKCKRTVQTTNRQREANLQTSEQTVYVLKCDCGHSFRRKKRDLLVLAKAKPSGLTMIQSRV